MLQLHVSLEQELHVPKKLNLKNMIRYDVE